MADRSTLVRLLANVADFKAQMESARRSVKGVGDEADKTSQQATTALGRLTQSAQKNRDAWDTAGKGMAAAGAIAVVAIGATVKAAIDWESAWAGVTKTVSGTPEQLGKVEAGLRGLARTLPATHDEIAAVAEAAGQLGVKTESIVGFTRTMINLGETTNLSADEAATSLAQLMNVMQTAPQDVGRLGAALVALGNDGASTEADIVRMASYITGSARLIGASESDVLALANAMTSMGINAERGGGVMTRVMQDVYAAVKTGGTQLEGFAKVAGMSSAAFARAFEDDPVRAIDAFIRGLNKVESSGGNVVATLGDLGYVGTQDTAVLLQMKGAGDLLTDSLDLGNKAWQQNTALVQEAAKRYDTTASKLAIARNNIHDAAIEVGDVFLPVLADLAEGVADVAKWFADLPDPIQATVGSLAATAGVVALAGGGFLLLFPRVIETYKAFQTLKSVSPGVASGLGTIGKAAGIAGIIIAASAALNAFVHSLEPAPPSMEETTRALLKMGDSFHDVDAQFSGLSSFLVGDIDGIDGAIQRLTKPSNMEKVGDFVGRIFGQEGNDTREAVVGQFNRIGDSLGLMVESGNVDLAAQQFDLLAQQWKAGGGNVDELMDLLPGYKDALDGVANTQETAAQSARMQAADTALLRQDLEASYGSITGYAAALGLSEDATKDLIEASAALGESLGAFIDPLGAYTGLLDEKKAAEEETARATAEATTSATDSWEDYVADVDVSLGEYMARLEEQVTAQQNWQVNMLMLAGRVSEGTLAELARMGPEGAALVADLVNGSDAELDRFDDITAARSKEATDAWGAQLTMAQPVLQAVAAKAGQGVVDELARQLQAGTITIAQIAAQYGISLAGGINPILTALGRRPIAGQNGRVGGLTEADGGVVDFYANGGARENHVAQIAPAGAWRVWAEPETGGEAYIPFADSKRARSIDIWRQVGDRLGVQFQEFAFGGISDVPKPSSTSPYQPPLSTAADATMQKAYDEITAWLVENVESVQGGAAGPLGAGALSGSWTSIFNAVKAVIPQARVNSAYRPGDPGAHGRNKAVDFGFGSGPGGAGSAGLASINRLLYDRFGGSLYELIYDGFGDDRPDIKNRVPHTYPKGTQKEHANHVHAAVFAKGGILNPHVRDAGGPLLPGYTFNGTGAPEETVLSNRRFTDAAALAQASGNTAVIVKLDGARISGTVAFDPSGILRFVDARIDEAQGDQADKLFYAGG